MDLLLDTICAVDLQGRFVYASASCVNLFGYTPAELEGRLLFELVHPDDRARTRLAAERVADGEPIMHFENRYIHKDGHTVHVMWSARWSETDQLRLAVARDITSLKQAEFMQTALYRISEAGQRAEGLPTLCKEIHHIIDELLPVRNLSVVVLHRELKTFSVPYCVGEARCLVNAACAGDSAYPGDPAMRQHSQAALLDSPIAQVIRSGKPSVTRVPLEPDCAHAGGWREWLCVPLLANQKVIGALVIQGGVDAEEYTEKDQELLEFVSAQVAASIERKQAETHLRHMAGHDPLTNLPNRNLFLDRLEMARSRAKRDGELLAVLYLDLDDFKQVNDRYGHETGDKLLCMVAKRLARCLRASDTVARIGGDEFTVLLVNIRTPNCAALVGDKIRAALKRPFNVLGQTLTVNASIGSAIYPSDGQDFNQLLRNADMQMYIDKRHKQRLL
ncbi:diguanylate cyclase [Bradymonas sediminis]|uniref:Diguanylate cyclase n=2 Tax=Bradymonas sediminis TaxID=1548548 RepID=A0A2Z4FR09_9DELT|nr:diguanylate cyclase [Bradymonas sediminis]